MCLRVCVCVYICVHVHTLGKAGHIFVITSAKFLIAREKKGKRKIYFHLIVPAKIKLATQLRHTLSQR